MAGLITVAEYARRRGVSRRTVYDAIASGRITAKQGKLDPTKADADWAANTKVSSPRNSVCGSPRGSRASSTRGARTSNSGEGAAAESLPLASGNGHDAGLEFAGGGYADYLALHEKYKAGLARLRYLQEEGTLIKADEVRRELAATHRTVKEALLGLPARVSGMLAGLTEAQCHELLVKEIDKVLEKLSRAGAR